MEREVVRRERGRGWEEREEERLGGEVRRRERRRGWEEREEER